MILNVGKLLEMGNDIFLANALVARGKDSSFKFSQASNCSIHTQTQSSLFERLYPSHLLIELIHTTEK